MFPASTASTNPQAITNVLTDNPTWLTVLAYTPDAVILVGPMPSRSRVAGDTFVLTEEHEVTVHLSFDESERESTASIVDRLDLPHVASSDGFVVGPFTSIVEAQQAEFLLRSNGFAFASRIVVTERDVSVPVVGADLVPSDAVAGSYVVLSGDARALEVVLSGIVPNSVPLRVVWVGLTPSVLVGPLVNVSDFVPPTVEGVSVATVVVPEGGFSREGEDRPLVVESPMNTRSDVVVTQPEVIPAAPPVDDAPEVASAPVPVADGVSVFVTTTRDERAADFVMERLASGGFAVVKETLNARYRVLVVADSLADAQVLIGRLRDYGYLAYVMGSAPVTRVNDVAVSDAANTTTDDAANAAAGEGDSLERDPEVDVVDSVVDASNEPSVEASLGNEDTMGMTVDELATAAEPEGVPAVESVTGDVADEASEEVTDDTAGKAVGVRSAAETAAEPENEAPTTPATEATTGPGTETTQEPDAAATTETHETTTQERGGEHEPTNPNAKSDSNSTDEAILAAAKTRPEPHTTPADAELHWNTTDKAIMNATETTNERGATPNTTSEPEAPATTNETLPHWNGTDEAILNATRATQPTNAPTPPTAMHFTQAITTNATTAYIHITGVTDTLTLNTITRTIPTALHPITVTLDGDAIQAYVGPYHPSDATIINNELTNLNLTTRIIPTETPITPTAPATTLSDNLINGMRIITLNETLNGTYLQLTTSSDPNRLTDERDTLTSLGYVPYILMRGERYALVIGPLDNTNVDALRRELRRKGITSFPLNETRGNLRDYLTNPTGLTNAPQNPNPTTAGSTNAGGNTNPTNDTPTTLTTNQPTPPNITIINLDTLTQPRNYLQLTAHNPNNPPPTPPNAITTTHNNQTITLIGPINNNDLQTTADNLNYPGIITTYPMPTPTNITPNTENQTWTNTGYERLHLNAHTEAREAFIEALYWDVTARETLLGLAITEHLTNDPNAAEFAYQYLLRHHPNDIDGNYNLSILHLQNNNPQQAIPHLTTALTTATQTNNTHWITRINLTLGHAYTQLNQHEQAANAYANSHQTTPNTDTLLHQYNAHYRSGRTLELLPELTIHERNTNDPRITHLITTIYLTENQPKLALETINRRINRNPNRNDPNLITLHTTKAEILTQQNQTQQATREWETILNIDPTNTLAFNNIITLHLINNQPHTAKHKILTNPIFLTNETTLTLLTEIAHQTNDTELLTALTTNQMVPVTPRNDLILANHECNQRNFAACLTRTTRILTDANEQTNTYAIALHAEAAYETGDYTTSVTHYQRLIDLNVDAREHLATAQLAAGDFMNAKVTLLPMVEQDPTNAHALHMLGWAQLRTNEIEPARQTWLKAIALQHEPAINDHNRVFNPTNN